MKQAIVTSVLVAGLAVGSVGSAYAAKGGNGKGPNSSSTSFSTSGATLFYECEDTCSTGEIVHFWGSGYDASQGQAMLNIDNIWSAVAVANDGSVDFVWNYFQIPYTYKVQLYQKQGNNLELKSEVNVTIQ